MTPKKRRKRGRPRKEGTILTRVRLSVTVYDAYCRRALMHGGVDVRTIMSRTLAANVRRDDLTPRESRALALALLLAADDMERTDADPAGISPAPKVGPSPHGRII